VYISLSTQSGNFGYILVAINMHILLAVVKGVLREIT